MKKIYIILLTLSLFVFSGCVSDTTKITIKDSVPVNVHDSIHEPFSFFLTKATQYTNLTQNINISDMVIYVNNTTNCSIFNAIDIYDDKSYFQGLISNKTDNSITINSEVDRRFNLSNTVIKCGDWNLATSDGSVTPEEFTITPPHNSSWHIISTVFKTTDNSDWDLSGFGGGSPLVNGISGRVTGGHTKDLFLIYDNSGFGMRGFEVKDFEKAPAGIYGYIATLKFSDIYGVVVQLDGNLGDMWKAVNRDDLRGQEEIAITVNGHYLN